MEKMQRLCLLFIITLLQVGCHQAKVKTPFTANVKRQKIAYPHWFWTPPTYLPFPTAVGYSAISHFHPNKALEDATEDGMERLAKSIHVRIRGERSAINGKLMQQFQEETDAQVEENIQETHEILAIYQEEGLTMVLVGTSSNSPQLSTRVTEPNAIAPDWIDELPRHRGYLYARGQSVLKNRPKTAWAHAEYQARIALALSVTARVSHLERAARGQIDTVTRTRVALTLRGIQNVARWYDAAARICYVLVRVPTLQHNL